MKFKTSVWALKLQTFRIPSTLLSPNIDKHTQRKQVREQHFLFHIPINLSFTKTKMDRIPSSVCKAQSHMRSQMHLHTCSAISLSSTELSVSNHIFHFFLATEGPIQAYADWANCTIHPLTHTLSAPRLPKSLALPPLVHNQHRLHIASIGFKSEKLGQVQITNMSKPEGDTGLERKKATD